MKKSFSAMKKRGLAPPLQPVWSPALVAEHQWFLTVKLTLVECCSVPLVPVIVSV